MSTLDTATIRESFIRVRERVDKAAERAGRQGSDVTIVAVTKKHPAELIERAGEAGIRHVGENYAQELVSKLDSVRGADGLEWHFIGHLQRNKVKTVVGRAALVHAIDSLRLAEEVEKHAARLAEAGQLPGGVQRVLVAVNVGGEEQKSGVPAAEAGNLVQAVAQLAHVECAGLMTMPPFGAKPGANRPYFRELAALRDAIATRDTPLSVLSMGTSGDFEEAVEEGATIVRVGSTIFGARPT